MGCSAGRDSLRHADGRRPLGSTRGMNFMDFLCFVVAMFEILSYFVSSLYFSVGCLSFFCFWSLLHFLSNACVVSIWCLLFFFRVFSFLPIVAIIIQSRREFNPHSVSVVRLPTSISGLRVSLCLVAFASVDVVGFGCFVSVACWGFE